jgi:hypothetical protein
MPRSVAGPATHLSLVSVFYCRFDFLFVCVECSFVSVFFIIKYLLLVSMNILLRDVARK